MKRWLEKWYYLALIVATLLVAAENASGQTGTPQTKAQLNTETTTNFPDNTTGLITPLITRQSLLDYIASWQQAPTVNAQTGTTYTVVVADFGKFVTFNNASPVAVTLPQATGSFANFNFLSCNKGSGTVTITPTTSTINGNPTLTLITNACTTIVSDGTNYQAQSPPGAAPSTPTISFVTSGSHNGGFSANGSGTYTTPAGVKWIEIRLIGGGGGGSGGNSGGAGGNGGNTCWNTTGAACTSPVYQAGGGGGAPVNPGGTGGTIAGSGACSWSVAGSDGETEGNAATGGGGSGGPSMIGGAGGGAAPGTTTSAGSGKTGSGAGGGGGGTTAAGVGGSGGGSGAACFVIIGSPGATFTYAVGAAGTAGTAGASAGAGGAGGDGQIFVVEHYNQ